MQIDRDSAQVRFPPPLLLLLSILIGLGVHFFITPKTLVSGRFGVWLGLVLIGLGLTLIVSCATLFKKAKTDIKPWKTTSAMVTHQLYRYSRNPIYLSFILIGLGFALAFNTVWIAWFQIPLFFILQEYVIKKEEHYLEQKFGKEYLEYKSKVRRWI